MTVRSADDELGDLLESCAQEQIHLLGMIQPHGILLVLSPKTLKVQQASANAAHLFGLSLETILEKDVTELLGAALSPAMFLSVKGGAPTAFEIDIKSQRFTAMVHRVDGGIVLELEQLHNSSSNALQAFHLNMHFFFNDMITRKSNQDLCDLLARQHQELTGVDRTHVYCFNKEFNGTVVAEVNNGKLPQLLGHSFPESDIPRQARELYSKNPVRQIVSVKDVPVPIFPLNNPATNNVLDLSYSSLRSVSPIHIEYMKNMGIESSFSVSIMFKGKLWGLIGCHSSHRKHIPRNVRAACMALCSTASTMLEHIDDHQQTQDSLAFEKINLQILRKLVNNSDWVKTLISYSPGLLDVVPASGAVVVREGRLTPLGKTPNETEISALIDWLNQTVESEDFQTSDLSSIYKEGEKFADTAAGILALKIPFQTDSWIIWFRAEVLQEISWAGDPHKPVTYDNDNPVLTPRQSFAVWKEKVKGKSKSFSEAEINSARTLISNLKIAQRYHK